MIISTSDPVARLCRAVLKGNLVEAREALDAGASPNARDVDCRGAWRTFRQETRNFTILHEAVAFSSDFAGNGNNSSIMGLLIRRGAHIDAVDESGNTPLHVAAYAGQWHACHVLIKLGANVNAQNAKGMTALHAAATHDCVDTCRLLVGKGADPTLRNSAGQTAAELALEKGRTGAASLLHAASAKWRLERQAEALRG